MTITLVKLFLAGIPFNQGLPLKENLMRKKALYILAFTVTVNANPKSAHF